MPVIKSAKKKLRQDKKRTERNSAVEETMRFGIKKARKSPSAESVRLATKVIDKAVKNHILHKNKAARVKSALAKLLARRVVKKVEIKPTTKKSASKNTRKSTN